ncbi:alkane 1-monooxygenase [Nevskia ramosa]|uniref:alkane 1-monooxygenase n=1 Tax=Nevskia ramosa TaxID=64002 RepID=UPI0025D76047|nr:alkane 1-monooxygenase [uncultured Nevskia sp.]
MTDTLRYYLAPATTLCGVIGFLIGGNAVWLGIATFPLLLLLDVVLPRDVAPRRGVVPFLADLALYLHVVLIVALYATFALSVKRGFNPLTGMGSASQIVGSLLSLSWLSAVPNLPVAHELMHRRHWFPRRLAQLASTFYGDPNRDVGHVLTHHIHLDTPRDCDTPYRGEILYAFVWRASVGSYSDAVRCEASNLRRKGLSPWNWRNRLWQQLALLALPPALTAVFAGPIAAMVCLGGMFIGKTLVEAFNYFQHYGLIRVEGAPVQLHHAWNHLGSVVRPLGVEITNHIHHHLDSYRRFYALPPEAQAPQMPSLFLCFLLALIPPLWFAWIAKPRLRDWDRRFATPAERQLAMAANARAGWPRWLEDATAADAALHARA